MRQNPIRILSEVSGQGVLCVRRLDRRGHASLHSVEASREPQGILRGRRITKQELRARGAALELRGDSGSVSGGSCHPSLRDTSAGDAAGPSCA
jgi:hypothetical protein